MSLNASATTARLLGDIWLTSRWDFLSRVSSAASRQRDPPPTGSEAEDDDDLLSLAGSVVDATGVGMNREALVVMAAAVLDNRLEWIPCLSEFI